MPPMAPRSNQHIVNGRVAACRHRRINTDSSNEARKQIIMRDRLRISKPVFQKADFLGDDFSLLSAVDETDAYIAVGVEATISSCSYRTEY